jgi:hypothetical protein
VISHSCFHVLGIIIVVDAHKDEHVAVTINELGVRISQRTLQPTNTGYLCFEHWATSLEETDTFGVLDTGSYVAGRLTLGFVRS